MNLKNPTIENLTYLLNELADHLSVVNRSLFDPEDYDLSKYEDIKFMYDMVVKKGNLSALETQAFIEELRKVRL
ncbi:DUF1128 domain-containing protein [Ornithinibacillus sp. BX22]|uniref:DUF1128 domain-containing protein n=2 Tax=Ornithinibacillus TaxID=484508 RepID=A0A923RGC8_9BACI|nr:MULTISPECIES: DUF1128 domain-containing protein [Ornithinibacillus]MBC5635931.1 DUF1128 domain-containing protein [Ornithinibacillus hominis]MBS3680080.1 DUF1128 domain-containing protein [Ornithinibacillus massiliensis]